MKRIGTLKSTCLAVGAAALVASLGFVPSAHAATATGTISVTAIVGVVCSVNSPTLAFGTYTGTTLAGTATVAVTCTNGGAATVALDDGLHHANATSPSTRALASGSNYLSYDIFTDSGHATIWGGSTTQPVLGTGAAVNLTAYGQIPAGQTLNAGAYTDTVNITVTF